MKRILQLITLVPIFLIIISIDLKAQNNPDIEKLDDAVVVVLIYDHNNSYLGHGSGFFIDSKGTVLTNYHVVDDANYLKVRTNINGIKKDYDVDKIICGSKSKDLAKISIKNPSSISFPYLELASSYPSKGDDCWAIGTPADPTYMNSVSKGLISNLYLGDNPKSIQTNAEITHGSSGGALINKYGQVIGVTSFIDGTENGARASINFAIWIGEASNLPSINKSTLVEPQEIPCEISFYTNNPFAGDVYLYVDGIYIGNLTKYFKNNYTPTCGESGTITRYLYAGTHSYTVYYSSTGQSFYGSVTLSPGQCKIYEVEGPPQFLPGVYMPYKPNITYTYSFDKILIKNRYVCYAGISKANGFWLPISFALERYFFNNHRLSLKTIFQYKHIPLDLSYKYLHEDDYDLRLMNFGIDLKRHLVTTNWNINWHIGPYLYLRLNKKDYSKPLFITDGVYNDPVIYITDIEKLNGIEPGLRFGFEKNFTTRFCLVSDFGFGYNTGLNSWVGDINFYLGFRFF